MAVVEALGLASSLAQTLLTALQNIEVRELCSMFRCETQFMKLKNTLSTINALLRDIDAMRQGLTDEGQDWIEKLKDAVYEIGDLLDEFATIGQQRKQMQDAYFFQKVPSFFSRNNKYLVDFNMSREMRRLREMLADITKDHYSCYSLDQTTKHVVTRPETSSRLSELKIVGRKNDKETVLHKLLLDSSPSDYSTRFVCIVGMGGLGKTTLAQLVYNDNEVQKAFSPRIWVCVSEQFGPKDILGKILEKEVSNLEAAQREVRTLLESKRYLLVLDDVWNESHGKWRDLMPYLVSDVSGSKIIVTSHSKNVAKSIGRNVHLHELEGLSEEESWRLFKTIAFETETEHEVDHDLLAFGKDIVKKCVNVPLCIRVIASLLIDQPNTRWELLKKINLSADMSDARGNENSIMTTLTFSYFQLTPELKSCFSFCSLFPKGHAIQKELLISLWCAQGYLVITDNFRSREEVGEHYITILLNRCFFQDIQKDEHDDVYSFKLHDLMHDLALKVAGKESLCMTAAGKSHLGKKICHLFTDLQKIDLCLSEQLRTCMWMCSDASPPKDELDASLGKVSAVLSICKRLRVFSLCKVCVGSTLPDNLGKLLHLRYLDLSENRELVLLPESIASHHNLQILKLMRCINLKQLPKDTSKLVNLRELDIHDCVGLTYMPSGMNNLKNLHKLTKFVVGGAPSNEAHGRLVDLQALKSLRGDLCIRVLDFSPHNIGQCSSNSSVDFKYPCQTRNTHT